MKIQTHTIAACQVLCGPDSSPEANARKIVDCLRQAAGRGARLALFPELSLSGYTTDEQDIAARAAATTPELVAGVCQAAQELGVAAVFGLYEPAPAPGKVYNVSLAAAPDGTQTRYRKIHICPNEPFHSGPGQPVVADLGFARLALSVCYDNWYPETTRMAFLNGAQLLHVPFYWPAEWERRDDLPRKRVTGGDDDVLAARRERMLKVFPGRALDNALYLVLVDHAGRSPQLDRHMPGKSMVYDPYGELIAESRGWEEETLYFEFDPGRVAEWRNNIFFPGNHLRPEVYQRAYEQHRRGGQAAGLGQLPDACQAALRFAAQAHHGQSLPGTNLPYLVHLSRVCLEVLAALRLEAGHDEVLAAQCALLHDVVEDTEVTGAQVRALFGPAVAEGVLALSKDKSLPPEERLPDSLRRIRQQPPEVWMVKMADRIANLEPPPAHWTLEKIARYREEARQIHAELAEASPALATRLLAKIEAYAEGA